MRISCKAIVLGDDVNTDLLHPPAFFSTDPVESADGVFAGLDLGPEPLGPPPFIIVAGENFGCGSSRESTVRALGETGVAAVVASSVARIFRRNAVNLGIRVYATGKPQPVLATGDGVVLDTGPPALETAEKKIELPIPDEYERGILEDGGLVPFLDRRGWRWEAPASSDESRVESGAGSPEGEGGYAAAGGVGAEGLVDVAVIGAGAAGLAAAVRVRFVKRFDSLPLEAVLFEASKPGGLLAAGEDRILTGPSCKEKTSTILSRLMDDAVKLEIPIRKTLVTGIRMENEIFILESENEPVIRARSIVVATGSRPIFNELDYFGDGVYITGNGIGYLPGIIEKALASARGGTVAVVTNRNITALAQVFDAAAGDFLFIVPPGDESACAGLPGRIRGARAWRVSKRGPGGFLLEFEGKGGAAAEECGSILLDYISFQNRPALPDFRFPVQRTDNGVPRLDSGLQSSVPGLFLAGDAACGFASVVTALSGGITAGFGAYTHAYRAVFERDPSLFAYRAPADPARWLGGELPELEETIKIRWLNKPPEGHPLAPYEGETLARIRDALGITETELHKLIENEIARKTMSLKPDAREKRAGRAATRRISER